MRRNRFSQLPRHVINLAVITVLALASYQLGSLARKTYLPQPGGDRTLLIVWAIYLIALLGLPAGLAFLSRDMIFPVALRLLACLLAVFGAAIFAGPLKVLSFQDVVLYVIPVATAYLFAADCFSDFHRGAWGMFGLAIIGWCSQPLDLHSFH